MLRQLLQMETKWWWWRQAIVGNIKRIAGTHPAYKLFTIQPKSMLPAMRTCCATQATSAPRRERPWATSAGYVTPNQQSHNPAYKGQRLSCQVNILSTLPIQTSPHRLSPLFNTMFTLNADQQEKLTQSGLTPDQINHLANGIIQPVRLDHVLGLNVPDDQRAAALITLAAVAAGLPQQAPLMIIPQDDDIPTIAVYIRELPADHRKRVETLFQQFNGSEQGYTCSTGNGFIALRQSDASKELTG
ncbi:hypothetical protein EV217_5077 [Phyllobacterium myrsinacearum]|nr:hypothetical protein EV217_5077 [Phyllobacterium myrsinacearum]